MSSPTETIHDLLWSVYEREGFRSINQMARASDVNAVTLWRWMATGSEARFPKAAESLKTIARITGRSEEEIFSITLKESLRAGTREPVPRTGQGRSTMARKTSPVALVISALVQRFGSIEAAERDLALPEGTLLGMFGLQLEQMTVRSLRDVAEDIGVSFPELVRYVEQRADARSR